MDVQIDVVNINDAPVIISTTVDLDLINEDEFENTGTLVSDLLSNPNLNYYDVDQDAGLNEYTEQPDSTQGMAITSIDTVNGDWEYSTDDGDSWSNIGTVLPSAARLLDPND